MCYWLRLRQPFIYAILYASFPLNSSLSCCFVKIAVSDILDHGGPYPNETKDGRQLLWDAVVLLVDPTPVDTVLQWHADDRGERNVCRVHLSLLP